MVQLKQWKSHKIIRAARIVLVSSDEDSVVLMLDPEHATSDDGTRPFVTVPKTWPPFLNNKVLVGGYFILYSDGYESWSPAKPFEEGYTEVAAEDAPVAAPAHPWRELTGHQVNPANDRLKIEVLDGPGAGGACHLYHITGFDSDTNASDLWKARHGKPAKHSTVLFQNGPINEVGVNGVTHEALLAIIIDRLEGFQKGPFACPENEIALNAFWLAQRVLAGATHSPPTDQAAR